MSNNKADKELASKVLATVLQALSEYSFVHSAEHLQQLVNEPEIDLLFIQEVTADILDVIKERRMN